MRRGFCLLYTSDKNQRGLRRAIDDVLLNSKIEKKGIDLVMCSCNGTQEVNHAYISAANGAFKNLFLYTKMRNVAGLSTSEAQKSSDMFMKCKYLSLIHI